MSQLMDIQSTLSQKNLRRKLSREERAELLRSITSDLEWYTYYFTKGDNLFEIDFEKGENIKQSIEDLKFSDLENMVMGRGFKLQKIDEEYNIHNDSFSIFTGTLDESLEYMELLDNAEKN